MKLPDNAKKVFQGERWRVYQWEQVLFDDSKATYETVGRNSTVIIYAVIGEEVVIAEEEQPHWGRKGYTIIAGCIEENENPFDTAKRELEEETGMVFKDFYLVSKDTVHGNIQWDTYTFVAKNHMETKEKKLDAGERNEIMQVSFDDLIKMTRKRQFFYRPEFIDEFIIRDEVDKFFDILRHPENHSISLS